ncbi:MAG: YqaE/Pmp3 family membrane protein [Sphingomonas sp.]|uniref:YqaE/Pmp3 family membrane protein n=1 Tax=Sphingomonas sp. TaxID=28214 RepID=UPI001B03687D|nr:YqaE/Pmp3 family membrane protein [Sphingomonas sp.]MBO9622260.1 YqaE/Pmp3 family membrane protein [Sphingomonas sp.]
MKPSAGRIAAAALLPPLGVYLERGSGSEFLISCGLTLLGFVPGMAYALWMVLRREPGHAPPPAPAAA